MRRKGRKKDTSRLPVIPIREAVAFPHTVFPFFVAKRTAKTALDNAMAADRQVVLVPQTQEAVEPGAEHLYGHGTVATVSQIMKLPDGSVRVMAEGKRRVRVITFESPRTPLWAYTEELRGGGGSGEQEAEGLSTHMKTVQSAFERFASLQKKVPNETQKAVREAKTAEELVGRVCANVPFPFEKKLELLKITDPKKRLEEVAVSLESENDVLELRQDINQRVKKRIEKNQRDYYLNEQMKEINRELGRESEDPSGAGELSERLEEKDLPDQVRARAEKEIARLSKLQSFSPEAGIVRTYVDWILDLPWTERTRDQVDMRDAERILDEDHYDMEKPKERVLDYIAVRQLQERLKGPILCLVGPPGTGKTSLGRSVARCLGRSFVRISLGGVRDEAEIRGHRRTYVGALPGKIIQSIRKAGTNNPVFLLDEVDKLGADFRGDPASALLEVLDPEQNTGFVDHYLELPFDLSQVLFITTANTLYQIPHALRDRMEIIEMPGYTPYEKRRIAQRFIIPKQIEENGLEWADVSFRRDAVDEIIHGYTRESGVRNLERQIATVIRKIAREVVSDGYRPPISVDAGPDGGDSGGSSGHDETPEQPAAAREQETDGAEGSDDAGRGDGAASGGAGAFDAAAANNVTPASTDESEETGEVEDVERGDTDGAAKRTEYGEPADATVPLEPPFRLDPQVIRPYKRVVTAKRITHYLGKPPFSETHLETETAPGIANGLAWTEVGGKLLPVEALVFEGNGELLLTGSLGDVMKESARTAFSFIRSQSQRFRLPRNFERDRDIHIHVPEGAIPKDGPSAGITIAAALVSAFSGISLNPGFAMTGEITLAGRLLPIGGVKEKALAAHRNGMNTVLLPEENRKDVEELPEEVTKSMEFHFAENVADALRILFPEELFNIRAY
ncbi:MAG: endopeptidase La [Spirochaetes bacterium]|jgi:ATP-dependent Lon protease|nr:endopeptidase La [Spirochaetota bacterium]